MDLDEWNRHLSSISTIWTMVLQAHGGEAAAAAVAQRLLVQRYSGAIHRYLVAALRDQDAADEVFQEFALRFVRGDFRRADPQRGRFRDFVKTSLFHLIVDFQKRQRARLRSLDCNATEPAAAQELTDFDREFLDQWRNELLARAWDALAKAEQETSQPLYAVLRFRAEHPNVQAPQMAQQLSARLGGPLTANGIRQVLHRARRKFTDLLLEEVARSLEDRTGEQLEQELIDLGLLEYCRPALARRKSVPT